MIDEIDRRILMILQDNARTSNADIARAVSMAPSAVLERVRKLERKGVITGYEARIDPSKVDLDLTAFTFVKTDEPVGAIDTGQQLAARHFDALQVGLLRGILQLGIDGRGFCTLLTLIPVPALPGGSGDGHHRHHVKQEVAVLLPPSADFGNLFLFFEIVGRHYASSPSM